MMNTKKYSRGDIIKVWSLWSLVSPVNIWHYGVVVGEDEVVHFNLSDDNGICIIKSNFERFINGGSSLKRCSISELNKKYTGEEVATRAEAHIGTDFGGYNLISNNCEHFANWCACGERFSNQIVISDEGEEHSITEKLFENIVVEPIVDTIEKASDFVDDLSEKTDSFFENVFDLFL